MPVSAVTERGAGGGRSEILFGQHPFSGEPDPQTNLRLGHGDDACGDEEMPLTRADRMFFMKLGYAFMY